MIHKKHLLHLDIKEDNLVWDIENNRIILIDFRLSYDYKIDNYKAKSNKEFSSINTMEQKNLLPRDDLESLFYLLVKLYVGKLPWSGEEFANNIPQKQINADLKKSKKLFDPNIFCTGEFYQISTIFKIIKATSQKEISDYEAIELLLKNMIKKFYYGKIINYKYQWENKISYLFKEEIENLNFQFS